MWTGIVPRLLIRTVKYLGLSRPSRDVWWIAFIETRALIRVLETLSAATELKRATTTAKNVPITPRAAIVNWWALKNSSGFKRQSCLARLCRVALTIAHHIDRLPVPIEVRPHISSTMAAGPTDEPWARMSAEVIFCWQIGSGMRP